MRKTRFSKNQIVGVLLNRRSGAVTPILGRQRGISGQTFYRRGSACGDQAEASTSCPDRHLSV
jgi:hypothetical protein